MRDREKARFGVGLQNILFVIALCVIPVLSCTRGPEEPDPEKEGLWSTLREKASDVVTETPQTLVKKGIDQTESLLETLTEEYSPVLREAGFEISEVRMTLGVPPGLAIRVRRVEIVSLSKQEELLDGHADDETLAGILKALFAMNRFDAEGYELKEVQVQSDIPPRVTLILIPTPEEHEGTVPGEAAPR